MNKSQVEKKVYVFHVELRVDVNDVKPFQNPTETSQIWSFPWSAIYAKTF